MSKSLRVALPPGPPGSRVLGTRQVPGRTLLRGPRPGPAPPAFRARPAPPLPLRRVRRPHARPGHKAGGGTGATWTSSTPAARARSGSRRTGRRRCAFHPPPGPAQRRVPHLPRRRDRRGLAGGSGPWAQSPAGPEGGAGGRGRRTGPRQGARRGRARGRMHAGRCKSRRRTQNRGGRGTGPPHRLRPGAPSWRAPQGLRCARLPRPGRWGSRTGKDQDFAGPLGHGGLPAAVRRPKALEEGRPAPA